jgi:DNA-binding response OmpR family regulator
MRKILKILSVDDNPQVLTSLKSALKHFGYEVFVTSNPNEVSQILSDNQIDLVMLDICMPEKDGFEIFEELKKRYKKLPVLFCTAYPKSFSMTTDERIRMWQEDFADGNTDIIYKPFGIKALCDKVESLIGPAHEIEK